MMNTKQLRGRISDRIYQVGPAQYYQPAYARIASSIGLEDGTLLDVGCGPGWLCVHVAAGRPDVDAVGIDHSPRMVQAAQQNKGPCLNVTIREMSGDDIKFPEATFDVATAVQTAHHWTNRRGVLNEIHRVLKPGGRLFLYEADRDQKEVPDGWIRRRSGWPPSAVVLAGWRRFGMNDEEWADLTALVQGMDFSNRVFDRHGFYRRMVLTK